MKSDSKGRKITKNEKDKRFVQEMLPHIRALYSFGYRLTGDSEGAKDLLQETYLKAYRFFYSYKKGTNAKAWLFRILKNSFINTFRKTAKEPEKIYYERDKNAGILQKLRGNDDNSFVHGFMGDEVASALMSLPLDFRTVILLSDIENFTYGEISVILNVPVGTVRSRLHRARNFLKDKLYTYAQKSGYVKQSGNSRKLFVFSHNKKQANEKTES